MKMFDIKLYKWKWRLQLQGHLGARTESLGVFCHLESAGSGSGLVPTLSPLLTPWLCALTPSSLSAPALSLLPLPYSVFEDSQAGVTIQIIWVSRLLLEVRSEDKPPKFANLTPSPPWSVSPHNTCLHTHMHTHTHSCTHVLFYPLHVIFFANG